MATVMEHASHDQQRAYLDHCVDLDAHEHTPLHLWPEIFGESAVEAVGIVGDLDKIFDGGTNSIGRPDVIGDFTEITEDSVWTERGVTAPGAFDFGRRTAVMDKMGIDRQLIFPGYGMVGVLLAMNPAAPLFFKFNPDRTDYMVGLGNRIIAGHNDWCARVTRQMKGRGWAAAILPTHSVGQMMKDAEHLLSRSIRAFWIPNGSPPADISPADTRLDPFWALCESERVALTFHIGGEFAFIRSLNWDQNMPAFEDGVRTPESNIQPFWGTTFNFASEAFLAAMTLGGVFERFPALRVGSIEVGANWIGPLAERMDLWAAQFPKRLASILSMRPSEYINRNVRVTPFHFEDVASYFERFPGLQNVYCFSTDYPHIEGGRKSKQKFRENLRHMDEDIHRKFFRENGLWLTSD